MPKRARAVSGRLTVPSAAPLRRRETPVPVLGPTVGKLAGVGADGQIWIDLPASRRQEVLARTTVSLDASMIGRELLIAFVDNDPDLPVVTGVMRLPQDATGAAPLAEAIVDAERIVLTGRREVVLRCGGASIALAADGRVVIKGANLLATASGLHRIRGGAVQIN